MPNVLKDYGRAVRMEVTNCTGVRALGFCAIGVAIESIMRPMRMAFVPINQR